MKDFRIWKSIVTLLIGAGIAFLLFKMGLFRLGDCLVITGAITTIWSFTFIHTMMGQTAARSGSPLQDHQHVTMDMRYNIREEKGYIPETLLAGILEVLAGLVLLFG